ATASSDVNTRSLIWPLRARTDTVRSTMPYFTVILKTPCSATTVAWRIAWASTKSLRLFGAISCDMKQLTRQSHFGDLSYPLTDDPSIGGELLDITPTLGHLFVCLSVRPNWRCNGARV